MNSGITTVNVIENVFNMDHCEVWATNVCCQFSVCRYRHQCRQHCPQRSYKDPSRGVCLSCPESCIDCRSEMLCLACQPGYFLHSAYSIHLSTFTHPLFSQALWLSVLFLKVVVTFFKMFRFLVFLSYILYVIWLGSRHVYKYAVCEWVSVCVSLWPKVSTSALGSWNSFDMEIHA